METVVKSVLAGPDGEKSKGFKVPKGMLKLVGGMTIERIAGMVGDKVSPEILFEVNEMLNKIKKP